MGETPTLLPGTRGRWHVTSSACAPTRADWGTSQKKQSSAFSHIVTVLLQLQKLCGRAHVMGVLQWPGTGPQERQKGQKRMRGCALCRRAV